MNLAATSLLDFYILYSWKYTYFYCFSLLTWPSESSSLFLRAVLQDYRILALSRLSKFSKLGWLLKLVFACFTDYLRFIGEILPF